MSGRYVLDGHKPVPCHDLMAWGQWLQSAPNRVVARTMVREGVEVSTVFLGLDHQFSNGAPLLFETMVFRNGDGQDMDRYSTWDEAVAGHEAMVKSVQEEAK